MIGIILRQNRLRTETVRSPALMLSDRTGHGWTNAPATAVRGFDDGHRMENRNDIVHRD